MEKAGDHVTGSHGGGTLGCQAELANHTNYYLEKVMFSRFFERCGSRP